MMKIRNVGKRPIWIGETRVLPNQIIEVDDKYEKKLKGLSVVIVSEEKILAKIEVVKKSEMKEEKALAQEKRPKKLKKGKVN